MGRTLLTFPIALEQQEEAISILLQALELEGFKPYDYKGEACYKKGTGMATSMQFVKIYKDDQNIHIIVWLRSGAGSAYIGPEMNLNGVVGAIPKKMLKDRVARMQGLMTSRFSSTPQIYNIPSPNKTAAAPVESVTAQVVPQPAAQTSKFCMYCGTEAGMDHKFCRKCGKRFPD